MATSTLGSGTLVLAGTTSGTTTVTATAVAGTTTLTLPAATDTLVGKATTDTLTNKTLTSPTLTGVATFAAGSAALPAITTTGDLNTGMWFPAADTIAFTEGGVESMRIDSSGNLGLGVTPSANAGQSTLNVSNYNRTLSALTMGSNGNSAGYVGYNMGNTNTANTYRYIASDTGSVIYFAGNEMRFMQFASGSAGATTSGTQAMTLDASGNLLVGVTSLEAAERLNVKRTSITTSALTVNVFNSAAISTSKNASSLLRIASNASGADSSIQLTDSVANNYYFGGNNGGAYVMANSNGVRLSNGGTSWASDSDERLKDIIEPIINAAEKVSSLRAVIGKYKTDEEGVRRTFLIAQDVQAVLPEAVFDEQGTLMLAYTDTIPLLVAAIKEQQAIITQLTARITALEGA